MKTGHRAKAFRLWRSGHEGLVTIQRLVDRAIKDMEETLDPKEVAFSGLPDLKLRVNRELRDNAAFELRHRRESLELEDVELAHKTDVTYLRKVRDRVEDQVRSLLELDDLRSVIGGKSTRGAPAVPPESSDPSQGPLQGPGGTATESIGNPSGGDGPFSLPRTLVGADPERYRGSVPLTPDYDGFCAMWRGVCWVRYQAMERDGECAAAAEDLETGDTIATAGTDPGQAPGG